MLAGKGQSIPFSSDAEIQALESCPCLGKAAVKRGEP